MYGDLVRVLPGLYESRPSDFGNLVRQNEVYSVFFPLGIETRKGRVIVVGHEEVPSWARGIPNMRRDAWPATGWWIWNGQKETRVEELNADQQRLSILQIWNYPMLLYRLAEGWSPAQSAASDADEANQHTVTNPESDEIALNALENAGSDVSRPQRVSHYLYFPTKALAESAAQTLREETFKVDVKPSAHDQSWLLIASKSVVPSSEILAETSLHLQNIARSLGGEYDWWDVASGTVH